MWNFHSGRKEARKLQLECLQWLFCCAQCLFGFSFKFVSIQRCPLEIEAAHYSYKQSVMTRGGGGFVGKEKEQG